MSANSALHFSGADFLPGSSPRQKLGHAVKTATLAVPMEEWQPWQFSLGDDYVDIFAQLGRKTLADDSHEREVMTRCGTALLYLKLALKHYGWLGRAELFPDLAQPLMVARIRLGFSPPGGVVDAELYEAMTRGGNSGAPVSAEPVTDAVQDLFEETMAGEKAWLEFAQSESTRARLVALAESGAGASPPGLHRQPPAETLRVAHWARPLLTFVVRNGDAGKFRVETGAQRPQTMGALAVIKTKTDDKHGWLAAGQALARIKLQARAMEISAHVFDQAFQQRRVREELRTGIGHKGYPQGIIGIGRAAAQWPENTSTRTANQELNHEFPDRRQPVKPFKSH